MIEDKVYLLHIQECIADIDEFVGDGREIFMASRLKQAAVLYRLQTMTESTQRLSEESRTAHGEVDWNGIRGFRNRLVHDYLGTNLNVVWAIIENDLPPLKTAVEMMLTNMANDTDTNPSD